MSASADKQQAALEVAGLAAGYRNRRVLADVSLEVAGGEIVALIGPNGAGKSTLLKAVFGLCRVFSGRVSLGGEDVTRLAAHRKAARGLVLLPQGNRAFAELTVMENLQLGGYILPRPEARRRIDEVLPLFPALSGALNRPAHTLSGGERQLLAFARALILRPRVLLLDEPSVGLSPGLVSDVMEHIADIRARLGCAIVVVEQKVEQALGIADRVVAMNMGRISFDGSPDEARKEAARLFLT